MGGGGAVVGYGMTRTRRVLRGLLLATGAVGSFLLALMMLSPSLAEFLLFQPDPTDAGDPPTVSGVEGAAVSLRASDGVAVHAWWYGREDSAGTVVVFHGNAGHLGYRVPLAEGLLDRGFSVLLAGYRGYGGSEGKPTEEGLHRDGLAAYAFATRQAGGAERVALLGRSLGGAVAAAVADAAGRAELPPEDTGSAGTTAPYAPQPPGALVLDSTFTSLAAMGKAVYPFLPSFVFRRLEGRYDTLERVQRLRQPVLVVHGREDRIVPWSMGRALYEAASGPRRWLEVEGAGHNDLLTVAGRDYFLAIERFLREYLEAEDSAPSR